MLLKNIFTISHQIAADDEEEPGGPDDPAVPVRGASPQPGTSYTPADSDLVTVPASPPYEAEEPESPRALTEEVFQVQDEPRTPQVPDDHSYSSNRPQASGRPASSTRSARGVPASLDVTLAPKMLEVHENIRDTLHDLSECITTNLPKIARSLIDLNKSLKSHKASE